MYDAEPVVDEATIDETRIDETKTEDPQMGDPAPVEEMVAELPPEDEVPSDEVPSDDGVAQKTKDNRNWFVVHTYSGYENKVKANLERRIHSMGMQDKIFRVLVPMEDEVEFKDGKRKITPKKVFPATCWSR